MHHLKFARGSRILDCGCGLSSFQFHLAQQGFDVHGLDVEVKTLEKVATLKNTLRTPTLHPTYGSLLDLPFTDEFFHGVLCISVLEHVFASPSSKLCEGAIKEMLRVLKVGGVFILTFDVTFGTERTGITLDVLDELGVFFGVEITPLPQDRLFSSDTREGLSRYPNLAVYSITLTKN